jgi:hypothetical protein
LSHEKAVSTEGHEGNGARGKSSFSPFAFVREQSPAFSRQTEYETSFLHLLLLAHCQRVQQELARINHANLASDPGAEV